MKFEEFVKNNLNPELFGGKRLTIDACMYLLIKQYVILKKDSVVNITCIVGASIILMICILSLTTRWLEIFFKTKPLKC